MRRRGIAIFIGIAGLLMFVIVGLVLFLSSNQAPPPPVEVGEGEETFVENGTPEPGFGGLFQSEPTVDPMAQVVEVVVSLQTVPRGWRMSEAELTTDLRLASSVGSNVITRIEDAVGLYARTDIFQGETLTTDALVREPNLVAVENYGPSSLIPQGWVAMAIPMDRLSSVAYGLDEGDSIDVMISLMLLQMDDQFQTLLENSAAFVLETVDPESGEVARVVFIIDPYGRFETLPNGDIAHIFPAGDRQPVSVSMVVQNAKVIQVGPWTPPLPAQPPTPTPDPDAPTPEPSGDPPTPTPAPPNVLVIALPPQQLLVLKYALEGNADIDFALRSVNDGQLYSIENVDLNYVIQQFNIDIPSNFDYTIRSIATLEPEDAP